MNRNGLKALVTPEESILLLMDHQPFQFANVHSHEPQMIVNKHAGGSGVAFGWEQQLLRSAKSAAA
jgi:hypothetical protein